MTKYSLIKKTNRFFIVVHFGFFKTRTCVIRLLHHLDSHFTRPIFMSASIPSVVKTSRQQYLNEIKTTEEKFSLGLMGTNV